MRERFLGLYNLAFDSEGNVKNCGRAVCQELIILADQIEQGVRHGDSTSGMMDAESIQKLKEII